ncbi:hypothetical protein RF11_03308 [Thelohanellus kitauei]|uniref:Uncharacterized protein n=1 Tax=Thelohanellus kitauei TaxID=669202 RepID=A0A0C2IKH5_THEKT|nr:hypothetical protein RF11_03308 [Thelohanellus kitauei]
MDELEMVAPTARPDDPPKTKLETIAPTSEGTGSLMDELEMVAPTAKPDDPPQTKLKTIAPTSEGTGSLMDEFQITTPILKPDQSPQAWFQITTLAPVDSESTNKQSQMQTNAKIISCLFGNQKYTGFVFPKPVVVKHGDLTDFTNYLKHEDGSGIRNFPDESKTPMTTSRTRRQYMRRARNVVPEKPIVTKKRVEKKKNEVNNNTKKKQSKNDPVDITRLILEKNEQMKCCLPLLDKKHKRLYSRDDYITLCMRFHSQPKFIPEIMINGIRVSQSNINSQYYNPFILPYNNIK